VCSFPPFKPITPGVDPVISQVKQRTTSGLNPNNERETFSVPQFITAKGGEYFFMPSIPALNSSIFLD
jgi:hypothetical protein